MMRQQQRLEAQFVDIEEEGFGFNSFKDIDYTLDQDANEVLDEEDEVSRGKTPGEVLGTLVDSNS